MPALRPIDELPDSATVDIHRTSAAIWLSDSEGVEYAAPKWLWGLVEEAWDLGYAEAQKDMREALGFVERDHLPAKAEDCSMGNDEKVSEVAHG